MFNMFRKNATTPIMTLPNELLAEIASYVPVQHSKSGYVVEVKSLASFAATSRTMCAVATPSLFKEIAITNERQLHSLARVSEGLLTLVQEFNLFVDAELLASLKAASLHPRSNPSPFTSLARILSATPFLRALRIRVAHSCGPESAWARTSLVRADGVPVGAALKRAFMAQKLEASLPQLTTIELDAFSDVAPLLRLAPKLENLRVYLPSGFTQCTNSEFVEALPLVPHLKTLVYSPESLRVNSTIHEVQAAILEDPNITFEQSDRSAELLIAIAKALPMLESLDLRTRFHWDELVFPASAEFITPEGLLEAGEYLRNIRHLALPNTVFTPKDDDIVRAPWPAAASEADLAVRGEALANTAHIERSVATKLGYVAQNLRSISFMRPARVDAKEKFDSAFTYIVNFKPEHTISLGRSATPITRPTIVTVTDPIAPGGANDGQDDALPICDSGASRGAWQRKAIAFLQENPAVGVAAAVSGGLVLSQVCSFLCARAIGA